MDQEKFKKINYELIETFLSAGKLCLDLRKEGLTEELKKDSTPVTNGDLEVNKILVEKISKLTPDIPIVSEESSHNKKNLNLNDFWLIDPIDGTYDYINDGEEFTINAGLILNGKAIAGLINVPAKKRMFYSFGKGQSYEFTSNKTIKLDCKKITPKGLIKVVSYSNKLKPEIEKIYKDLGVTEHVRMKSSLKFCVIAAGEFDGYVAEPRACEWDIAAGHAILEHSGGTVTDFEGNEILYGNKDLINPSIILKNKNIL